MASLVQTLAEIRRGAFNDLCNEQLTKLLVAVAEHEADGEIAITLKFKHNAEGQVICKPGCKIKVPTRVVGEAIFYVTEEGDLERSDPRQGDLKFDKAGA